MIRDLNIKTNIKRAGQGMFIILALFLFGNNANAQSITPTQYPETANTLLSLSLNGASQWYALNDNMGWCGQSGADIIDWTADNFFGICPKQEIVYIEFMDYTGYNLAWDNCGGQFDFVNATRDCFNNYAVVELFINIGGTPPPPPPTCGIGTATSALCKIGSATVAGSTDVLTNIINNYWGYIILFGILLYLIAGVQKIAKSKKIIR